MIIAAIIVGIILIFLAFLAAYIGGSKNGYFGGITLGMIIAMFVFVEVSLIVNIAGNPYPTAMDVYQGKTTLEYKVVDGVKVDSVVIFKNDDYGKN